MTPQQQEFWLNLLHTGLTDDRQLAKHMLELAGIKFKKENDNEIELSHSNSR